jgi:hypothetical protein
MVAIALSVLALAAGVYLLVKVKSEFLSGGFGLLAWLVILLSLVSLVFQSPKDLTEAVAIAIEINAAIKTELRALKNLQLATNLAAKPEMPLVLKNAVANVKANAITL